MGFMQDLRHAWQRNNSLVCVGLDPEPARFPAVLRDDPDATFAFPIFLFFGLISIHASLRDATKPQLVHLPTPKFQSTHPCGMRLGGGTLDVSQERFQSTHPCGMRRTCPAATSAHRYFNPRIPAGCDVRRPHRQGRHRNFNPRIPAGCDEAEQRSRRIATISIHASLRDATPE